MTVGTLRRDLQATDKDGKFSRPWYDSLIATQNGLNGLLQATLYTDTGVVNAMVISSGVSAYTRGLTRYVKPAFTNTATAVTLNDSGLGAKAVKLGDGSNPAIGQLVAGSTIQLQYTGSVWEIVNLTATDLTVPGNLSIGGTLSGVSATFTGTLNSTVLATFATLRLSKAVVLSRVTVTYSASMTPDVSLGSQFVITATNGVAFTINAPTNPFTGQPIRIVIRNTSGGALGAVTWNAVFKMSAWTSPANGQSRSIEFEYDGTNWVQVSQTGIDVPN